MAYPPGLPPAVNDFLVAKGYIDADDGNWTVKAGPEEDSSGGGEPVVEDAPSSAASAPPPPAYDGQPRRVRLETREPVEDPMADTPTPKTPDITPAQLVALVGSALALGAAFGLDVSQAKQDAIIGFVTVAAPFLLGADAVIRAARAAFVFRNK